jgi:DNA polymerase-3 subunit beta
MQIQTKALINELTWANRFIEKKTTIPILSNILFEAQGDRLTLTGTDLEIGGSTAVIGSGSGDWSVAVPVVKLIKYLGKVDEPEVALKVLDGKWLSVRHGGDGTKIAGMSKESYPELPSAPWVGATLGRLSLAVARTEFAISKEESRFTLNGALLEVRDGEAHLMATDGHRLSRAPLTIKGDVAKAIWMDPVVEAEGAEPIPEEKIVRRVLLPKKTWLEAARLDGDCTLSTDEKHAYFNFGQRQIITRKLAGNFPDWQRVFPAEFGNHAIIPVKSTLKTLERVALYADERSRAVAFSVNGEDFNMSASCVEEGSASGTVAVRRGEGTEPFTIGLNADYIAEFLRKTEAQSVSFCWQSDEPDVEGENGTIRKGSKGNTHAAAMVTADAWSYLVMPMRM